MVNAGVAHRGVLFFWVRNSDTRIEKERDRGRGKKLKIILGVDFSGGGGGGVTKHRDTEVVACVQI